jgi:signal transduction histidine kinase
VSYKISTKWITKFSTENIGVNLANLSQDLEQICLFNCQKKALEFAIVMNFIIPKWIVAGPTRMRQVIHNLLNNAIKFIKTESISFNIKFTSNTSTLLITVIDSGENIARDVQTPVFEYFRHADFRITHNFGGYGLGLFIIKSLLELMGGVVELQSTLVKGLKFCVTIVCQEHEGE